MPHINNKQKYLDEKYSWDISDIIKSEEEFFALCEELKSDLAVIEGFKKDLSPNMSQEEFSKIVSFNEVVSKKGARLLGYVGLMSSMDIKSQEVMKYSRVLERLELAMGDKARFFSHWIMGLKVEGIDVLDDENAKRLFRSNPFLESSFLHKREAAKHALSEREEQIIHRKEMYGIDVVGELYDHIVNDFSFEIRVKERKKKISNLSELTKYFYSRNREERVSAYKSLLDTYSKHKEKFFSIYSAIIKDLNVDVSLRNFKSPISAVNFSNELSEEAVNALISSCEDNEEIFREFFRLKKRILGISDFGREDVYAPLGLERNQKRFSYAQSKKIIMDSFEGFCKDFKRKATEIIDSRHVDVYPKENKRSGAFCAPISPDIRPYVLMNFTGTRNDVSTLAHELGHGIHAIYSSKLPMSVYNASIPLCETASVLCETIVAQRLFDSLTDVEKISFLGERIMNSYATICRQNRFIIFEIKAHDLITNNNVGEEELSELYYSNISKLFGDSLKVSKDFRWEWCYIPHIIHSPFYCYSYSFGNLLSLSIYNRYKKEGSRIVDDVLRILSSGSSENPEKLLMSCGYDVTKKEFWDNGFSTINEWVSKLRLLAQKSGL